MRLDYSARRLEKLSALRMLKGLFYLLDNAAITSKGRSESGMVNG